MLDREKYLPLSSRWITRLSSSTIIYLALIPKAVNDQFHSQLYRLKEKIYIFDSYINSTKKIEMSFIKFYKI